MRLLLLGCTGFVGKELVPTLLNENHEIYIVSRKPISKLKLDLDFNKFKFFQIDLSKEKNWNNENLLNILRETDGIINLMGEPIAEKKWTSEQKQEIENSRINTTKFMMKTLKNLKINQDYEILISCGTGGRSQGAAEILSAEGYNCSNISDGFLGDDSGKIGWKNNQLPTK